MMGSWSCVLRTVMAAVVEFSLLIVPEVDDRRWTAVCLMNETYGNPVFSISKSIFSLTGETGWSSAVSNPSRMVPYSSV